MTNHIMNKVLKIHLVFLLISLIGIKLVHAQEDKISKKRIIVICAHPDDAEITSGGTSVLLSKLGYELKFVSVTNGNKGYYSGTKDEIAHRRYKEVQEVKKRLRCEYEILDNNDGELEAHLKNRMEIIRLIREWKADIVITHPPYDYHPDHRYTSLLVQDASFLVNVPHVLPHIPELNQSPLFLYTRGRYTNPIRPQPDITIDITSVAKDKAYLIDAHVSQVYEFLPWINKSKVHIPETKEGRLDYILKEYVLKRGTIQAYDREVVQKWYGQQSADVKTIEAFEICEFGRTVDDQDIRELFPMLKN